MMSPPSYITQPTFSTSSNSSNPTLVATRPLPSEIRESYSTNNLNTIPVLTSNASRYAPSAVSGPHIHPRRSTTTSVPYLQVNPSSSYDSRARSYSDTTHPHQFAGAPALAPVPAPSSRVDWATQDINLAMTSASKYECSYCGKGFNRPSSLKVSLLWTTRPHIADTPTLCRYILTATRERNVSVVKRVVT